MENLPSELLCTIFSFLDKQDSKELSPRSLDKMLLKLQVNSQNIQSTQLSKCFKSSKSSKSCKFSNMSKLVQILYDLNCYDSYDSHRYLNMFKQTCQNLFRFNMIRIVTIHMILKHVWTCSESIWHESLRFSNMSKLVQNQSDMNWYDSQTCLNMLKHV